MPLKAVVIDDDLQQREMLVKKLHSCCPHLLIAGSADSVSTGIELIKTQSPDIVFLDVEMPPYNGFDLLNQLQPVLFEVIFVTSFTHFAYKAFKVAAIDYLHKPFDNDELINAVAKAEEKIKTKSPNSIQHLLNNIKNNTAENVRIGLPMTKGYSYVAIKEIVRVEGANKFSCFYFTGQENEIISKTLSEVEEMLSDYNFYRIHQSHLVNLRLVKKYLRGDGGQVEMMNGEVLNVSRQNKDGFLKAMNSF